MASTTADSRQENNSKKIRDLEVKDAHIIFSSVWASLEEEFGEEQLRFPKEIFWLNGAPGAGKGTNTNFIMQYRDLTAPPLVVSDLLHSPEAERLKDAGMLVGDREVVEILFRRLLDPVYQSGAAVDGFPRTK
ncbi:MAG TPA: adenylate kinase, partial [Opitutae bacterium]|nr:adenylate kinase [Opitutae bacterium]